MAHAHRPPSRALIALFGGDVISLVGTMCRWQCKAGSGQAIVELVTDEMTLALQKPSF